MADSRSCQCPPSQTRLGSGRTGNCAGLQCRVVCSGESRLAAGSLSPCLPERRKSICTAGNLLCLGFRERIPRDFVRRTIEGLRLCTCWHASCSAQASALAVALVVLKWVGSSAIPPAVTIILCVRCSAEINWSNQIRSPMNMI